MTVSQLLRNRPSFPYKVTVRERISVPLGFAIRSPRLHPSERKVLALPNYVNSRWWHKPISMAKPFGQEVSKKVLEL